MMDASYEQEVQRAARIAAEIALAPTAEALKFIGIGAGGVVAGTGQMIGQGMGGFAEGLGRGAGGAPVNTAIGWGVILGGLSIVGGLAWVLHKPVSRIARGY